MEKWISLSHSLSESTPGFSGEKGFFREEKSCICKGRNSNSEKWTLHNHHGTHIDCPYHFDNQGKKMSDYKDEEWIFRSPFFLEIEAHKDEIIDIEREREQIPLDTDILFIKTSFEKFRNEESYWSCNPGLSPLLGTWLRANRPKLKVVGFDFISLTSYQNRPLGKEAHLAFLSPVPGHEGIRIIEDMKLSSIKSSPSFVLVSPLLVEDADGGPVNVWARFN